MVFKNFLLAIAITVFIFLFTPPTHHSDELGKQSLEGLTDVFVLVSVGPDMIKRELPFDENKIRVDAELKLRMAGIKVLSEGESVKGMGRLYINLVITPTRILKEMPMLSFRVKIFLDQMVSSERKPKGSPFPGTTWVAEKTGIVRESNVSQIRDAIKDQLDIFINDYLSVNPKGGK
jgi:hypothetical protein